MTLFFKKATYLFTLFTLACGGSATKGDAEGDASGKTNDDATTAPIPTASATPDRMLGCVAGMVMAALGCGDGGAEASSSAAPDGGASASDTRLPDTGTSPMMDAQASKDSTMPNDTTPDTTPTLSADGGSDGSVRADAQPMGADAQPPLSAPRLMEIIKKLKIVPARVIFVTLNRQVMVTTKNVTLPAGLPPPRNSFMSSICRRDELGVYEWQTSGTLSRWRYAIPLPGGMFEPATVLTKTEIEKLGIDMNVIDKGPNGQPSNPSAPRFTAMSIDEWLSAQPDVEAALEALKPEALCY